MLGRYERPSIVTLLCLIILSHCVNSQFPPLIAARSIIADPGCILSTISLSISIGAGLSGINAVETIVKCQSKIIFCGVGKSAKIAAKLSSTFSSVGSPSFVLSSGDSSHGDIGSVNKKDILILISYSGETQELKNIIQYANRNRITLIGIVSKNRV